MSYKINYAGTCFQGLVRQNNEDNFWCSGKYLPCENAGINDVFEGTCDIKNSPSFAIFDGMGGEECGEIASFLAVNGFDQLQGQWRSVPDSEEETFIRKLCQDLNDRVCKYAQENNIGTMGSTAVLLLFHEQSVCAANVGDSRIYRFCDHKLGQISKDHVCRSWFYQHPLLTQFLGIPSKEALLSPCIRKMNIAEDESFLLCSDGLTDMFTDQELEDILDKTASIGETVKYLKGETLRRGAWDNTTIILCKTE